MVYADTGTISVPGDDASSGEYGPWMPPETKEYTLFAEVIYPADEVPPNDTLSRAIYLTGVSELTLPEILELSVECTDNGTLVFDFAFPGSHAKLCIFDAISTRIDCIDLGTNQGTLQYQPTDDLSEGIYFARLSTPFESISERFTKLH